MSIIEGSTLRRISSSQINRNLVRTDSGVGAGDTPYSSIRTLETVTFSQRVQSPDSGVRAPQDSIDFSQKAYDTGRSLTRGHRLGAADARRWQYTIDSALQAANKKAAQRARSERLASLSQPLTTNYSSTNDFELIASNDYADFSTSTAISSSSTSPTTISWEGKQALESYGFFSSMTQQGNSYTVEA